MKSIVIFDLDETLTESKAPLDQGMSSLLLKLLDKTRVCIISGGRYEQFQMQALEYLDGLNSSKYKNLYLCPTSGAAIYEYKNDKWNCIFKEALSSEEKMRIYLAIFKSLDDVDFDFSLEKYGDRLEDRETQITISFLGQDAPCERKKLWDPDMKKRQKVKVYMDKYLPDFDVKIGGSTSIDITRKGIDKGFGVNKLLSVLKISKENAIFVGDKLQEGGNDYAVRSTGVECIEVKDVAETKKLIADMLSNKFW